MPESITGNYFSIGDILATHNRIPCKVETDIPNLGNLDPSSGTENLAAGTKLELPYWLVRGLCKKQRKTLSVELPSGYKRSYRDILSADAKVVDLHKLGPHFYEFGLHLLELPHPEVSEVGQSLVETFKDRLRHIMDSSQNILNESTVRITSRMDELEKSLFAAGQKCLTDFQRWQTFQADKITTSAMIINHRKRKRHDSDE